MLACALTFVGIWIGKGMGPVVPGSIPTPLGGAFEYTPTLREILNSVGIWAFGAMVFTLLAKASMALELGCVRAATAPLGGTLPATVVSSALLVGDEDCRQHKAAAGLHR